MEDIFEESESELDMFTFTADSDKRAHSSEGSSFFSDDILDEDEEDFEPIFPDTESDEFLFDDDEVTYSDSSDDLAITDEATIGVYEVKSVLSQLHAFRESVEDDDLEAMRGIEILKKDEHSPENDKKDTESKTRQSLVEA